MNWHSQNASKLEYRHRNKKAHIIDNSRYGFYSLCGQHIPTVTVDKKHAHEAISNTCKKCLSEINN